jgi:WD40 repeat protein
LAIICDSNTSIRLWDVASATQRAYIEETDEITPRSVQFSPDSRLLAMPAWNRQNEEILELRQVPDGRVWRTWKGRIRPGRFSPDGSLLVGALEPSAEVGFWEVASGREVARFPKHSRIRFCPNGDTFLAPGESSQSVQLWQTAEIRKQALLKGDIEDLAFSPDGKVVALQDGADVRIYSTSTGDEEIVLHGLPAARAPGSHAVLGFSHDGRRLACKDDRSVTVCDLDTLRWNTWAAETDECSDSFVFSADGSILAKQCVASGPAAWDLETAPPKWLLTAGSEGHGPKADVGCGPCGRSRIPSCCLAG